MPLPLVAFVLGSAAAFSIPVIVVVLLARRRMTRRCGQGLVATSFAVATGYVLWRIEWFDVWRHGAPSVDYLAVYALWMLAVGAAGWFVGGSILRWHSRSAV